MIGRHPGSTARPRRGGLTLLEVVIALAILLFSVAAISQLLAIGHQRAIEVQQRAIGTMLCQRKLAELTIGAESLNSSGYAAFPEEGMDQWQWKVDATQGGVGGLWNVQVTVKFEGEDNQGIEVQMGQMILDPTLRGSNQNPPPTSTSSSSGTGPTDTSGTSGSSTPAAGATTPAATTPATTAPKTTTPARSTGKGG